MNIIYSFDEFSIPLWIKALFWGLYMVIFVYALWKMHIFTQKYKRNVEVSHLFLLYFILYAVFFGTTADYFNYREWIFGIDFTFWGKEQIYVYIILFCRLLPIDYPYEAFRLIIWGGALLLVLYTSRLYQQLLEPGLTILFLFLCFNETFCYARASLAMAVFFLGVSIYLWREKYLAKIFGIGIAICSYFFHHELIMGIAALPCLWIHFEKKKSKLFSLILLAIIIGAITYINSNLALMESVFGNDELAEKIEHFNEKEQRVFRMSTFIGYLTIFYPFFLITNFFHRHKHLPKALAGIYRITFILLLATVAFFVVSGPRAVYTYRVLNITIIPMSIMIAYCYNQGLFKKYQFAIVLLLALLTNSVRFINAM